MWPKEGMIELDDGRRIRLIAMYREDIYANLAEGDPCLDMNIQAIRSLAHWGSTRMDWAVLGKPPLILPPKVSRGHGQPWVDSEAYHFDGVPPLPPRALGRYQPEWMPGTGTVALFYSDAIKHDPQDGDSSHLMLIWFQREPVEMIEAEPLAELRKIPWDRHATSWSF